MTTPTEDKALTYLSADIYAEEGRVLYAYPDNRGLLTIGEGFLIDKRGGGLRPEEVDFIKRNRMTLTLAGAQKEAWYPAVASEPVRLAAILDFLYQLGDGGDEKFANSFSLIAKRDWKGAANAMRQSLWAKQTPARAARVTKQIETGVRA